MNCAFLLIVLLEVHYSLQQFINDVDCFLESNKGNTYIGAVDAREDRRSCIKWKEKPYEGYSADHNYCRNPKQHQYRPWCFSAVQGNDTWGYCNIPYCDTDCLREADKGVTYNGTVSTTADFPGVLCVKWKDVINNTAGYREDHKFCRNPDIKDKPWCYTTTAGDWKYCNTPSCALIKCKTYPEIDNMIRPPVRPEEYTYLETINITCQNGYYVNGTSGIQCEPMGKWSTPYPLCIGQLCPEFPNIQNTNELNKTVGYRHPENVTVTCQKGYEMNGSPVVMCNAGKWGILPTCIGKPCPEFPNINNTNQLNKTIGYRHPEILSVTCQTGYEMKGSSVVQCNSGIWGTLPKCIAKPCPPFTDIVNAIPQNKTDGYYHSDTVTVTCQAGYNMSGSAIVLCNAGVWISFPKCFAIRIPTIEENELFIAGISTLSIGVVAMIVGAVSLYIAILYRKRSTKKSTENYIDLQTRSHSITDPYSTLDHTEYIEIQNGR